MLQILRDIVRYRALDAQLALCGRKLRGGAEGRAADSVKGMITRRVDRPREV